MAALLIKWMALLGYSSGKIVLEYHIPGAKKLGTDAHSTSGASPATAPRGST
ncbi:hypothetical protein [Nonomuraea cypriaca]|uniref:hypothetical protein n=1 Tax=Nonomuraea cypriaca TaxID=1187855 RepID=UPI001F243D1B|nr:hypothetical protein [Nonomuraea cypriaca]